MKETAQALYQFFSSFDIPAYEENSVPDDAQLPYITYTLTDPEWTDVASVNASVWYKGTSLAELSEKVDQIKKKVTGGYRIPTSSGCVFLYMDTPFAQIQNADEENNEKMAYLLFVMHALTN